MKRIALTGGIATGKSTVLQRWLTRAGRGVVVLESDQLAHEAYAPGTPTYERVVGAFGDEILNADRTIHRRRLGAIVFADDQKRLVLNRLVHPAVRQMWADRLATLAAERQVEIAVVAIPLLYEAGAEKDFDVVVAVGCSEPTQLARLMAKGLPAEQARARQRAQWPQPFKLDRADYVIWNDGELAVLAEQADIIWALIKENGNASTSK